MPDATAGHSFKISVVTTAPDGTVIKNPEVVIPNLTLQDTEDMINELTDYLTKNWTHKPKGGGKK